MYSNNSSKALHQEVFEIACRENNLEEVVCLLNNPLCRENINIKIPANLLVEACFIIKNCFRSGYLEIGDYLLNQPEVTPEEKHNIINSCFASSCGGGNLMKVKELFVKYFDLISLDFDKTRCYRAAYNSKNKEILEFLIRDVGISLNNKDVQELMYPLEDRKDVDLTDSLNFCERLFLQIKLDSQLVMKTTKPSRKI